MARGLAALDRTRELDRAAVEQQLFGQRGFASVWMRNNGEGAATPGLFEIRHENPFKAGHYTQAPARCNCQTQL